MQNIRTCKWISTKIIETQSYYVIFLFTNTVRTMPGRIFTRRCLFLQSLSSSLVWNLKLVICVKQWRGCSAPFSAFFSHFWVPKTLKELPRAKNLRHITNRLVKTLPKPRKGKETRTEGTAFFLLIFSPASWIRDAIFLCLSLNGSRKTKLPFMCVCYCHELRTICWEEWGATQD